MNYINPRLNASGCPDPTAYAAIEAVSKEEKAKAWRPLVYVCSPFAGDVAGNTERARQFCHFAVSQNAIPLAPHLLYPQFMDDGDIAQRELALFFALVLLGKCEEVWVFGDSVSEGMSREIAKAKRKGTPARYFSNNLEEVIHHEQ